MKRFALGILVGFVLSLGVAANASEIQQFILTRAPYPVFVNGAEYLDEQLPVLIYQENTYVPLAKFSDLLGATYKWNEQLGGVEVSGMVLPLGLAGELAERQAIKEFQDKTVVEIIEDEVVGYDGYPDDADPNLVIAQITGKPLPPKLSEGWVSERLLSKIFGITETLGSVPNEVTYVSDSLPHEVVLQLTFPAGWDESQTGEVTLDGIRIKRHGGVNYLNIADLEQRLQ